MTEPAVRRVAVINYVRRGGMVHYHAQLVNALSKKIETVALVASAAPKELYRTHVSLLSVDTGNSGRVMILKIINPLTYVRMRRSLRSLNADVVHVTSPYIWNIFVLFWLRKPLVYTVHDPVPHRGEKWYVAWIDRQLRRRAKILMVHGRDAMQQMQNQGYAPSQLIPTAHGDFGFLTKWSDKKVKEERAILFFGRIEPYKGLEILLKALPQIWHVLPDWRLIIAGHGSMPEGCAELYDSRVEIHNYFIPDEEVARYFQRAAIVVLPYISATQSGVVPIASAFAKPVVATRVGGLPEAVADGQTGLLVAPGDIESLAAAIKRLATDATLRRNMGTAARDKMAQDMSWEAISNTHLEAYRKAVSS